MSAGRVWVKIRASEAERAEWHAKARSAGLTLSDLLRRSVGRVRHLDRGSRRRGARAHPRVGAHWQQSQPDRSLGQHPRLGSRGRRGRRRRPLPPFNSWLAAADDAAGQPGGHRRRDSGDGAPRSLPRQRRGKLGVQRGAQRPLGQTAMFNIAWAGLSGQTRPPPRRNLGRQNRHTLTVRGPIRAVSTTGKKAMSQVFQRRIRAGPGSANGR